MLRSVKQLTESQRRKVRDVPSDAGMRRSDGAGPSAARTLSQRQTCRAILYVIASDTDIVQMEAVDAIASLSSNVLQLEILPCDMSIPFVHIQLVKGSSV